MVEKVLNNKVLIRQIFLYALIGGLSASADSIMFVILRHVNIYIYFANFLSINIGITLSFLLNTFFNFKKTDRLKKRALSFYSIGYCGLLISMFILWLGTDILKVNEILVKLSSVVIVAMIQFVLNKFITYREVQ